MEQRTISDDTHIAFGGVIKALGDGLIEGLAITFTNADQKDLDGEYFDASTDYWEDRGYQFEKARILYHHGLDGDMQVKQIGDVKFAKKTDAGVWIQAQLDMADEYNRMIYKLVENGKLGWSTGALPQSYQAGSDGHIKSWAVIEASLTPSPAMPLTTRIHTLKSLHSLSSLQAIHEQENSTEAVSSDAMPDAMSKGVPVDSSTVAPATAAPIDQKTHEVMKMDDAQLRAMIVSILGEYGIEAPAEEDMGKMADELEEEAKAAFGEDEETEDEQKSVSEETLRRLFDERFDVVAKTLARIEAQSKAAKAEKAKQVLADARKSEVLNSGVQPEGKRDLAGAVIMNNGNNGVSNMRDLRYDHWTPADFALAATLSAKSRMSANASPLPIRTDAAFWSGFADSVSKSSLVSHKTSGNVMKAVNAIKANELDHSTQTSYGDEWVPTVWSNEILDRARQDNVILPLIQNVNMPSNPFIMPVESTDPSAYYVAETTAEANLALNDGNNTIPDSKIGTNNITLTAAKLGTRTGISSELQEDGVPGLIPMYRRQAERVLADSIDNIILNADNATSGNVNFNGGTPTASNVYMGFAKGLVKSALVANSIDASGSAPTLAKIRQARFTLQNGSISAINDLAIIVDNQTYGKLLGLDEFITMDKAGPQATAQTGLVGFIDGIRVFMTAELALAATDGLVSNTGGDNVTGRLLVVDTRYWYMGYRRQITQTLEFLSYYDSWQMTTTVRLALVNQNDDHTAMLYNLAV